MATQNQRAAAPGIQIVRIDNVKAASWVEMRRSPPLIGQIFFSTDNATLDFDDMRLLDTIVDAYHPKLIRYGDIGKRVNFEYLGYADYRHTKEHNYALSQSRADVVSNHLSHRLRAYSAYGSGARGLGIDYRGIDRSANSKELQAYRRVDIIADPVDIPPPPKQEQPGEALSDKWRARLIRSAAAGYGVVALDVFQIEIADCTNNIAMTFKYVGIGLGASIKGTPGFNADKSNWFNFTTTRKINVMDFGGGAIHLSGQAQVSGGGSIDELKLYGPEAHRGAARVSLEWYGLTPWGGKGAGVGAIITGGGISPDPPQQKAYPAPL
jgi:outer membrane protein OmpA-like peptidoglycan-associated protein